MTKEEILTNLCYYDNRNPEGIISNILEWYDEDDMRQPNPCYCDNCFYNRTQLAEELLKYVK